jgi:hypothetical protein
MMEIRIQSYFSLPTDLAGAMRDWQEFVVGEGYSVDLRDAASGEEVTVRIVDHVGEQYVVVYSPAAGRLFDRTLGRVICALSDHSDHLMVDQGAL